MRRRRKPSGSAKSTPCCARNWRRSKSGTAASARHWRAWKTSSAKCRNRREQITRRVARWGENRARILTENIELDQKLTALAEQIAAAERTVLELAEQEARHREALAAADEVLRDLRARIETGHARRSRNRSRTDAAPVRTAVPR